MPWAIFLLLGVAVFRCIRPWVGGPENFAPLAALALCGSLYFPRPWNWVGPLLALFVSDTVLNLHYGLGPITGSTWMAGVAYLLIIFIGNGLIRHTSWPIWLMGSLGATFLFYLVTNTGAWWALPGYEKSFVGWSQALTTGLPGYPPTWTFLRASLVSDLLFTVLFVGGVEWSVRRFPGKVRPILAAVSSR
jgi:hypothetical protein